LPRRPLQTAPCRKPSRRFGNETREALRQVHVGSCVRKVAGAEATFNDLDMPGAWAGLWWSSVKPRGGRVEPVSQMAAAVRAGSRPRRVPQGARLVPRLSQGLILAEARLPVRRRTVGTRNPCPTDRLSGAGLAPCRRLPTRASGSLLSPRPDVNHSARPLSAGGWAVTSCHPPPSLGVSTRHGQRVGDLMTRPQTSAPGPDVSAKLPRAP
jgi:hypothetical protein